MNQIRNVSKASNKSKLFTSARFCEVAIVLTRRGPSPAAVYRRACSHALQICRRGFRAVSRLSTKDTKEHEGGPPGFRPLCSFVSFVVDEFKTLPAFRLACIPLAPAVGLPDTFGRMR